jgi:hypothetical protein
LSGLSPSSGQPLPSSVLNIQRRRRPLAAHPPPLPSFKPSSRSTNAPVLPSPSILHSVFPNQAPPLIALRQLAAAMAINGHCCSAVAPPPLLAL